MAHLYHWLCTGHRCGHEWDGTRSVCDWCGCEGLVLDDVHGLAIVGDARDLERRACLEQMVGGLHVRRKE